MSAKVAEKVPGWVERLLIPAMESRVRSIVKEEVGHLEKVIDVRFHAMDEKFETKFLALDAKFETKLNAVDQKFEARFDGLEEKMEARFGTLDTKIDSLDKQFPVIQDLAEIKARLAQVEKNQR